MSVLAFDPFVAHLRRNLNRDWDTDATLRLVEDLGCDSLDFYEILVILEELGAFIDPDESTFAPTLGDLHNEYALSIAERLTMEQ